VRPSNWLIALLVLARGVRDRRARRADEREQQQADEGQV
jgi:hypothetical protein